MTLRSNDRLSLIEPRREFEYSYRSLIEEIKSLREKPVPFPLSFEYARFDELLKRLNDDSKGIGIPEGFVANSSFWLVRDDAEIVGVSNLRHKLTPTLRLDGGHIGYGIRPSLRSNGFGVEILRQTLLRAKALGLTQVLITCSKNNIATVKVILANNGVLDSEEYFPPRNDFIQRYWIDLGVSAI